MTDIDFTFSETLAGRVVESGESGGFVLRTGAGRRFQVRLGPAVSARIIRNLGEPYRDCTGDLRRMLAPGRPLFARGTFYPEGGRLDFEAQEITLLGEGADERRFEEPGWWIRQIAELAAFYDRAQFEGGPVDYSRYRTFISLDGRKLARGSNRQETGTISRLVYGFATAFLLTGEDRWLEAAEAGTAHLREHMRFYDADEGVVYWYHGVLLGGGGERKVYASEAGDEVIPPSHHPLFGSEAGDDYDAIPAYEQIYALAGPVQTYRVTGDPAILADAERTLALFERFFRDRSGHGGFFSHLDPISLDPRSETLGRNRARKNWNSIGDHAPAYLVNLYLATGDERLADLLVELADIVAERFPDPEGGPFVQERFHEDWTADRSWGWQMDRAVVGHNLKIAWNLMRVHHLRPSARYVELARRIARVMPAVGADRLRGGWYDVVERTRRPGEAWHRFAWHDRKAWWQQEQAILAYLVLAGSLGDDEALGHGRDAAAFYNAFFLDHDDGGVYYNVLAGGAPYLVGDERQKGNHAMSGYHAFELCYLAAVYNNLLVTGQPLDLYFKPRPGGFPGGLLRVAPDILPAGRVRLAEVSIEGERYDDFDAEQLTVRLPDAGRPVKVRARLAPVGR